MESFMLESFLDAQQVLPLVPAPHSPAQASNVHKAFLCQNAGRYLALMPSIADQHQIFRFKFLIFPIDKNTF